MERRRFLQGALAAGGLAAFGGRLAWGRAGEPATGSVRPDLALRPPAEGTIRVAFLISEGSNVIDMAGPWEVFQDVMLDRGGEHRHPFSLSTVAASDRPVRASGGLHLIPDHTVADAPQPQVIVVPAMRGSSETLDFIRRAGGRADLVMSVCTGAFQLASAGLLDGRSATTHHEFWDEFEKEFPAVRLERGPRFVEGGPKVATAGGLTSGIDLALRVVERYFGRATAQATADYMEYRSEELAGEAHAGGRPGSPTGPPSLRRT